MLPAGLEPLNPDLKQAADDLYGQQQSNNSRKTILLELLALGRGYAVGLLTGWEGRWFDHQELKDDRCEAFTAYLAPGVYEYSYLTRATTLGVFIAPPPKVPPSLPAEEPSTLTWNPSHIRRTHPLAISRRMCRVTTPGGGDVLARDLWPWHH
jgi:hypothetical protein